LSPLFLSHMVAPHWILPHFICLLACQSHHSSPTQSSLVDLYKGSPYTLTDIHPEQASAVFAEILRNLQQSM
jgi:hypothetical protein